MNIVSDIVDQESRMIVQWDTLEDTKAFYPEIKSIKQQGDRADEVPNPDSPSHIRYQLKDQQEIPYKIRKNEDGTYRFETQDDGEDDQRPWIKVMQRMIYDDTNDILVGYSNDPAPYYVTVSRNDKGLEFSFFDGNGRTIGHARF